MKPRELSLTHQEGSQEKLPALISPWTNAMAVASRSARTVAFRCVAVTASSNRRERGGILPLDASDNRNPDHPCHTQAWLEMARALGRMTADREWERLHPKETGNGEGENSGNLCAVLK